MIELEFVVWEFVRLMVELEEQSSGRSNGDAYAVWRESWQELDARLTDLGKTDAEGFSDLMMEKTVTVPCASAQHLSEVTAALTRVTGKLKQEIKRSSGDAARRDELEFEWAELQAVIERLGAIDQKAL